MKKLLGTLLAIIMVISLVIMAEASTRVVSTADFSFVSFDKMEERAKISFDINANTVSDGVIGIAASSVTPKDYSDYAICLRIRAGGYFDAYNATGFEKAQDIYYTKNTTYRVEVYADIINQVYDAFVYINGEKKILAEQYGFRATAKELGKITVRGGGGVAAGLYYIENIAVERGEGFSLPNVFCENMVLQRNRPHVIYGRADGEVTVRIEKGEYFSEKTVMAENGEFKAELDMLPASLQAYTMTVSSKDRTQVIENVFIGDVFLLAGQSNMAQNYEHQKSEQTGDGVTESNMPQLLTDERVKFFKLSRTPASTESFNVPFETDGWQPLNDATKKKLSYIGMYFAAERLKEEPGVPIGFMSTAWRGTTINRWMRKSDDNKTVNFTPSNGDIYNSHIAPVVKYPVKAVLWYQGESDSKNPVMYEEAFKALIKDWRKLWNDEDMPFLFVQLARFGKDNYAPQRNAQMKALELENTGMAVILDTDKGTYNNIHPLGKETIAKRLHLLAKKYVYKEDIIAEGPIFESAEAKDGKINITFRADTIGGGLTLMNTYGATGNELCEFEVAAENGYFVKADAVINPDNTVTLSAVGVEEPVFARYAYSAVPENPNLFNKEGLPAAPFTTDTRIFSGNSFMTRGIEADNTDVQIRSFKICPMKDNINGVIGFTQSENDVTAWNSCGITLRFHENGFFEYIDGSGFKTSQIAYSKGKVYAVTVIADFTDGTYSAIVDGKVMCERATFRSGSLVMNNMGRFLIRGGDQEAAEEFFAYDMELSYPEENSTIEAESDEEKVVFVIRTEYTPYVAAYSDSILSDVAMGKKTRGVEALRVKMTDNIKMFLWDGLKPIK